MSVHALKSPKVADLKSKVSPEEWQARVDLAACYRLMDVYGMTDLIANHISMRVPGEPDHFLINAYGLLYDEIHMAKPEVNCVIHTHTWAGMAVSTMECGLLPNTQTSMRFAHISYHDFEGVVINTDLREQLVKDLGDNNAMILRNHGLLTACRTIPEAFNAMHRLELSCKTQIAAMSCNTPLVKVPSQVVEATYQNYQPHVRRPFGVLDWPALLRKLDRMDPSFRD
jgi:ribulose-5-phosphate 4-epimerase/fuculose-1-phosphate aldolase